MKIIEIGLILNNSSTLENLQVFLESCEEFSIKWLKNIEDSFENSEEAPTVILLETDEEKDLFDLIPTLQEKFKKTEIILLVNQYQSSTIFSSFHAGVSSILLKDTSFEIIKKSIITTASGGSYLSPLIARIVVNYFNGMVPGKIPNFSPTP